MLYLHVPYEDKDEVKKLHARWDPAKKLWYATTPKDYYKFRKWISDKTILRNRLYILDKAMTCWKCKQTAEVYAIGIPDGNIINLYPNESDSRLSKTGLQIVAPSVGIHVNLMNLLNKNFGLDIRYSKTVKQKYFTNICQNCGATIGDYFVFAQDFEAPFSLINISDEYENWSCDAYEVDLRNDYESNVEFTISSNLDNKIKKKMVVNPDIRFSI